MGLTLLLLILFAYRVSRLVTTDDITEPLRNRLARKRTGNSTLVGSDGEGNKLFELETVERKYLGTLLTCDWCFGFWVSLATVLAYHLTVAELSTPWWLWVGAVATGVGIISKLVND